MNSSHLEAATASFARIKATANISPEGVNAELKAALDTSAYLCRELPVGSDTVQAANRLHERLQRLFWATANTGAPQ